MSLEDKRTAHMQRVVGMVILFGTLGCVVLIAAITYVSHVITTALP